MIAIIATIITRMILASTYSENENIKDDFYESVNYDPVKDLLTFTIPENIPEGYKFYLHISGLMFMGESNFRTFHVFDEESINYTWEKGKTYEHFLISGGLKEVDLSYGLIDNNKELLYSYTIRITADGTKTIEKDE
ncbi:hypothetical protein JYG23_08000 [Sedimentibacter sp. zth1]|uniref:hypothetical protein n=1 Tax=Sedimentibacter sp. zth1 TaxID=2816908 RepID=UPI001A92FAC0|nr:hypothetical protein [Sedimentibacter sp. zth1]QSX04650.1 hypothetical protein JYG23_08000 [Sedimentibacter sp. zth1]